MTRTQSKALNRAPAPTEPASPPVKHAQQEWNLRVVNGSGTGSTGGRTNMVLSAKKPRRAGPRFTLDSAFASVPALVASHDPDVVSRDAKEEKAQRTIQELERQ